MQAQPALRPWRPILEGTLRTQAEASAREVIAALSQPGLEVDGGLAGGSAGLALLFAYAGRAWDEAALLDRARAALERSADALSDQVLTPGLYGGFTGIAWAHSHLERLLYGESEEDSGAELDDAAVLLLQQTPWYREYDLVGGLAGVGVYALERLPRPRAAQALELIVERLEETSETTPQGITWHTRPYLLPPHQRAENPDGYHNLGLAHGVPGVVALLAAIVARGLGGAAARRMLDGGFQWLASQRLPEEGPGCYATTAESSRQTAPTRLAWCYGDAGIAVALLAAAELAGHGAMRTLALEVGRKGARRATETAGVVDAGLCHGAAGLLQVFNRMFQATGEPVFLDAARTWTARTLELRTEGSGIAGYAAWEVLGDGKFGWTPQAGLFTGSAGIAAAFLAATCPVPPDWDRFLMVSFASPLSA